MQTPEDEGALMRATPTVGAKSIAVDATQDSLQFSRSGKNTLLCLPFLWPSYADFSMVLRSAGW